MQKSESSTGGDSDSNGVFGDWCKIIVARNTEMVAASRNSET